MESCLMLVRYFKFRVWFGITSRIEIRMQNIVVPVEIAGMTCLDSEKLFVTKPLVGAIL